MLINSNIIQNLKISLEIINQMEDITSRSRKKKFDYLLTKNTKNKTANQNCKKIKDTKSDPRADCSYSKTSPESAPARSHPPKETDLKQEQDSQLQFDHRKLINIQELSEQPSNKDAK